MYSPAVADPGTRGMDCHCAAAAGELGGQHSRLLFIHLRQRHTSGDKQWQFEVTLDRL